MEAPISFVDSATRVFLSRQHATGSNKRHLGCHAAPSGVVVVWNETSGCQSHDLGDVTLVVNRMLSRRNSKKRNKFIELSSCNGTEPLFVHVNKKNFHFPRGHCCGIVPEHPKLLCPSQSFLLRCLAQEWMEPRRLTGRVWQRHHALSNGILSDQLRIPFSSNTSGQTRPGDTSVCCFQMLCHFLLKVDRLLPLRLGKLCCLMNHLRAGILKSILNLLNSNWVARILSLLLLPAQLLKCIVRSANRVSLCV